MNINKYESYFHDGSIIDIKNINKNEIEIWMESSQLRPEWNIDNIPLSDQGTIRGKLHIKEIKKIIVNDNSNNYLKTIFDDGEILKFHISENKIELMIEWNNFPPKNRISQFEHIEIVANEINWENVSNFFNSKD